MGNQNVKMIYQHISGNISKELNCSSNRDNRNVIASSYRIHSNKALIENINPQNKKTVLKM